jgi:uncharacterized protein YegL
VVEVIPFKPAKQYQPPTLSANGLTAMNQAIVAGLDALEARKDMYKNRGIPYYKPWLFLLTDGNPTDDNMESAAKLRLANLITTKKLFFFPMGIGGGVNINKLGSYCAGEGYVLQASKESFKSAFKWISSSISAVSHSTPGELIDLPQMSTDVKLIPINS